MSTFKLGDLKDLQEIKRRRKNRKKKIVRKARRKRWIASHQGGSSKCQENMTNSETSI